ncbi:MAG: dihydroneopterin aldolase [Chitinophagales bacterium]|nr:dihydroneopterin aldolase [Chitinophagales bacterium]
MGKIAVEGMHFHAYHGYYERERKEGNHFVVDVYMDTDFEMAAMNDNIGGTINYEEVYATVKAVMQEKYLLLEHVSQQISILLQQRLGGRLRYLKVRVAKLNPPLEGVVDKVYIELEKVFD